MTACSSILALGMMPLCSFIYTSVWTSSDTIKIPFDTIGITLASLLIPIAIGIFVKSKWPRVAKKILKVGSITGFILIIVIAVVGGVLYQSSWVISPSLWIIGCMYPFIGYSSGFLLAWFVGQPWYRCRTVALETGFQNAQSCSTIVQSSFSADDLELMFSFPLIYSIFQLAAAICGLVAYQSYKRKCGNGDGQDDGREAVDATKEKGYAVDNIAFDSDELKGTYSIKLNHT